MKYSLKTLELCLVTSLILAVSDVNAGENSNSISTLSVDCQSSAGSERQHCSANTASGVILIKTTGESACLLGRNWGYDDRSIWVMDGCSAEFLTAGGIESPGEAISVTPVKSEIPNQVAQETPGPKVQETPDPAAQETTETEDDRTPSKGNETWGTLDPGNGFLIGRNDFGEASLSAYALFRSIDQMGDDTFTDHLDREQGIDLRNDVYSHRVLVYLKGWMGNPKFRYNIAWWTVNTTDQDALFGNLGYQFSKKFNLYGGINGNPGSRTMQGSHPYWLGTDRVMADEFFRPFFTQGVWANGELTPGLWYSVMAGNTSSTLGVKASQIDRKFTTGGSMWWMPTTHEFGPKGGFGDWEGHKKLATRLGFSFTQSPEERYTDIDEASGNTALKLADSLNLFSTGSLAPGVTVTNADYQILAVDAGMKYRGIFLQTELYYRTLDNFEANGLLPTSEIKDMGFYVQAAFFPIPKKFELYTATSQIYGDSDAGFGDSSEYLLGMNYYPWDTRNLRFNLQLMDVNRSPVSSTFGYYTGGQDGTTISSAFSMLF